MEHVPEPLPMPLDPYRLSGADHAELYAAEQALVTTCLRGFGVTYRSPAGSSSAQPPPEGPYGVTDPDWARKYGYRLPPALIATDHGSRPLPDPTTVALITGGVTYDRNGTPQRISDQPLLTTHHGRKVPEGGCLGEARRTLAGRNDNRDPTRIGSALYAQAYRDSQQDPRVTAATADWAACMKQRGFTYRTPLEPANDPSFPRNPPADERERATAVADVACKEKTGLVALWHRVESEIERSLMRGHGTELAAAKADRDARLAHARRINAGAKTSG
ncbi:hypothetical protein SVTN_18335 [Streptomyces vietnamensis]|uniref:Uncharacterized protein n=1 Tax=Streptomyces vietnamensis TaxID=362257 RepID=A0A0B5I8T0_9ACTN|nr:hypothetical protein SVTN_18335 [Streptomyces vietnamensis]